MRKRAKKYWSKHVTETSNAMDLEPGVFSKDDPHEIALSLKLSVESSSRLKGTPFSSAMSMLNLYINRAGKRLAAGRKDILERTKVELRKVFGKEN